MTASTNNAPQKKEQPHLLERVATEHQCISNTCVVVVVDAMTSPVEPPFTAAGSLRLRGQGRTVCERDGPDPGPLSHTHTRSQTVARPRALSFCRVTDQGCVPRREGCLSKRLCPTIGMRQRSGPRHQTGLLAGFLRSSSISWIPGAPLLECLLWWHCVCFMDERKLQLPSLGVRGSDAPQLARRTPAGSERRSADARHTAACGSICT